jgi:hypothetical protein
VPEGGTKGAWWRYQYEQQTVQDSPEVIRQGNDDLPLYSSNEV